MKFSAVAEDILPPLGVIGLFVLFYTRGPDLNAAITAIVTAYTLALLVAVAFVLRIFRITGIVLHSSLWGKLLVYSIPTAFTGVFSMFVVWMNRLVVGAIGTEFDAGIYQAASQSSLLVAIMTSGFNAIFAPMIADLYSNGEHARLEALYRISTKWSLYVNLPIFLTMVLAAGPVLSVFFGREFSQAAPALIVLSIGQITGVAVGAVGWVLMMAGRQVQWLKITATAFMASILVYAVIES